MAPEHETVIIGGGIAGLACARRLHDSQQPFLIITEDVGGRIRRSADGAVNLGAFYVRSDYSHVNRFVERGRRIKRHRIQLGDQDGSFTRGDLPLLMHPAQAIRFLRLMREFRRHYETFKQDCHLVSQAQAIKADPLLWGLYQEPATHFIHRHRIEGVAQSYLGPVVQGTAFTSVDRLTAFTLLLGVLPTITPIFEYEFRFDLLMTGFEDALLFDSVTGVTPSDGYHMIQTRNGGAFSTRNVVVAAPVDVSARLLDLGDVKSPIAAHMYLVRGNLRRPWARATYSMFPEGDHILAIAQQTGGSTLLCSVARDPNFGRYFSTWEVVEHHHWNPAFHLAGDVLLECEQGPGLYLVGDHNVCGLEDAYITGVYAANRILAGPGSATATSPPS